MKNILNSKKLAKILPYLFILFVLVVFFWKVFFKSYVAVPGDLMVGAYYPWHEYKWGYAVDVIIKNPLLSDSYSQFFIWKKLIAESYKSFEFPLWNPYSYSGYPLLANYHSGALYIFNFVFVLFKFNMAWNLFVFLGFFGSAVAMYLFLINKGFAKVISIISALTYSLSGFSITWSEFATAGQSLIWIPLALLAIDKYFSNKNKKYIFLLSPILFILLTAGHLQLTIFGFALVVIYFLYNYLIKTKKGLLIFFSAVVISITMAGIQLLPSTEMARDSIRFSDNYSEGENYGLLPAKHLLTFFAPDFFGNPTTGNYIGFFNYHETVLYAGIISFLAIIWALLNIKTLSRDEKFFLAIFLVSMIFLFDNPISRSVYIYKLPLLSTSTAGRVVGISIIAMSFLTASFLQKMKDLKTKEALKVIGTVFICFATVFVTLGIVRYIYSQVDLEFIFYELKNNSTSLRNMVLPSFFVFSLLFAGLFRKYKWSYLLILIITILDLFRFGWKYLPFVEKEIVFPDTKITDFLKENISDYRVDKERGPLLPPNTWAFYNLPSPSGYDPMAQKTYTSEFFSRINNNENVFSRYSEIDRYPCESLGNFSVKYLLALKRDEKDILPGNKISYKIEDEKCWERVYETEYVAVLENPLVKERYEFINKQSDLEVIEATPSKVTFKYKSEVDNELIIRNSWSPGWVGIINGNKKSIEIFDDIFQSLKVDKGEGTIELKYEPKNFKWGSIITGASIATWLLVMFL